MLFIIGSYELPAASYRGPFPTRRPPAPGMLIRGPSLTLPSGETHQWKMLTKTCRLVQAGAVPVG